MNTASKHYDVVVLGAGLGALTAASLLARRSWRVLVLGNGFRRQTYTFDGLTLARRPFTFLAASSPAWGRVLVELAQSQTFRRRLTPLDPMLQVLGPDLRLDLPPDAGTFGREIDREFPTVRRVVDDLYAELARTNAAADAAFERDAVWPPGGFWERRETRAVLATLPWLSPVADFLAEFPRDHAFRGVVNTPARFASDLAEGSPPFATARLHGAWTRGVGHLAGGEDELVDFLLDRVRAHGGDTRLGDRVSRITHKGSKARAVHVDGDELPVGVSFVVSDGTHGSVHELLRDDVPPREDEPPVDVVEGRFCVSLVVRREGVPDKLAVESFLLPERGLAVHLQRAKSASPGTVLLVAEAIFDAGASLERAREAVLETVCAHLPFVERHLLVVDSPHDGRPLWDFRNAGPRDREVAAPVVGRRAELVDRVRLRAFGGSVDAEPMVPRFRSHDLELAGLAGEPLRTSLGNVFVTGRSTLPALGQEGELLSAWGVARIITRTDRRKEKMLREMWSKVELS